MEIIRGRRPQKLRGPRKGYDRASCRGEKMGCRRASDAYYAPQFTLENGETSDLSCAEAARYETIFSQMLEEKENSRV